jgi:hypothetical protein
MAHNFEVIQYESGNLALLRVATERGCCAHTEISTCKCCGERRYVVVRSLGIEVHHAKAGEVQTWVN